MDGPLLLVLHSSGMALPVQGHAASYVNGCPSTLEMRISNRVVWLSTAEVGLSVRLRYRPREGIEKSSLATLSSSSCRKKN